jgi:hypothetical protein
MTATGRKQPILNLDISFVSIGVVGYLSSSLIESAYYNDENSYRPVSLRPGPNHL